MACDIWFQASSVGAFARAGDKVVIDKAGGLEKGVAYCGTEKFESPALHVCRYRI